MMLKLRVKQRTNSGARRSLEETGGARRIQEPGGAGSSHEEPGAPRRSKEQPPKWGHLVDISSYGVALEASPVGRAVLAEWCVVFHAFSRAGRSITKDH